MVRKTTRHIAWRSKSYNYAVARTDDWRDHKFPQLATRPWKKRTCIAKSKKSRQAVHLREVRVVVPLPRDAADDDRVEGIPLGRPPRAVVILPPEDAKVGGAENELQIAKKFNQRYIPPRVAAAGFIPLIEALVPLTPRTPPLVPNL